MNAITEADAAVPDERGSAQSDRSAFLATIAGRFQQAAAAVTHRSGVFYGVPGHYHSKYRGADDRGGTPRCSTKHEIGTGKLYPEPCGFHSDQRLDDGPVRNASGVRLRHRHLHAGVI